MTSQHDHELGSSEDTADGPERADSDPSASVDNGAGNWQRTDLPGDDGLTDDADLTDAEYTAGSEEPVDQDGLAESGAIRGDIIVAEVIDESPDQPVSSSADELTRAGSVPDSMTAAATEGGTGHTDLGQEWRDIQAAFVDDPAGAVQLAADATNAALGTLVDRLRRQQSTLVNGGSSAGEQDTEQLRRALREYRALCENVDQIGRRLLQLM
jgi:hypothetical protein